MKNILIGLIALPFLACIASANQPTVLDDAQMDAMTAGQVTVQIETPFSSASQNSESQTSLSFSFQPTQSESSPYSIGVRESLPSSPFPAIMPPGIASVPLMTAIMPQ